MIARRGQSLLPRALGAAALYLRFAPTEPPAVSRVTITGRTGPLARSAGGPVFVKVKDRGMMVVGVNVSQGIKTGDTSNLFGSYTEEHTNDFINICEIVDRPDMKAALDADRAGVVNSHLNPVMPNFSIKF